MSYYVYILANRRYGTLYIGITNDLRTRLEQHRLGLGSAFVRQYRVHRLVYVETYENVEDAIRREKKQLKKWNRDWKIRLVEQDNLAGSIEFDRVISPLVAPAKAGTHNHRCFSFATTVPHREVTAYGSPPSRGRQRKGRAQY